MPETVAYGGDAALLYEPDSLRSVYRLTFAGDSATLFEPLGTIEAGTAVQTVAFGGDASGQWPVIAFVTVDGIVVPVGADLVDRVRLIHYADAAALAAGTGTELALSSARGWATELSGPGSWTCQLRNVDTSPSIDYGSYVACELDGLGVFLGIVEKMDRVAIDPDEERAHVTTLAGRGVIAEWERALIAPPTPPGAGLYADVRHYGWMSPELPDSHWAGTYRHLRQDDQSGWITRWGRPHGWPDPRSWWVWSGPPSPSQRYPADLGGISYFRCSFWLDGISQVAIYAACDDAFELYLDGVSIGGTAQLSGWQEALRGDVVLGPGAHLIAIKGDNYTWVGPGNSAGLIVAVFTIDGTGREVTQLLRTGGPEWRASHYPPEAPGFTAGAVIRLLLEAAQADGELVGWTLDFDDGADTAGNPWPPSQQFSFPVGIDLLAALEQLSDSHIDYLIDRPARVLRAWRLGEAGAPSSMPAADLTAGLSELVFEGRA